MSRFEGRACVVTGGGDGIGMGICIEAGQRGMHVAVLDIRHDAALEVADRIKAAGGKAGAYGCDITESDQVSDTARQIRSELGEVGQLWANAGVVFRGGLLEMTEKELDWMTSVNISGTLHTVRSFVPEMLASGAPGHVVITGSVASILPAASPLGAYCSTKYMSIGIAEALRAELRGTNVGASMLIPGRVATVAWNATKARPERFGGFHDLSAERSAAEFYDVDGRIDPLDLGLYAHEPSRGW